MAEKSQPRTDKLTDKITDAIRQVLDRVGQALDDMAGSLQGRQLAPQPVPVRNLNRRRPR